MDGYPNVFIFLDLKHIVQYPTKLSLTIVKLPSLSFVWFEIVWTLDRKAWNNSKLDKRSLSGSGVWGKRSLKAKKNQFVRPLRLGKRLPERLQTKRTKMSRTKEPGPRFQVRWDWDRSRARYRILKSMFPSFYLGMKQPWQIQIIPIFVEKWFMKTTMKESSQQLAHNNHNKSQQLKIAYL